MTKDCTQSMMRSRRAHLVGDQAITEIGAHPTALLTHSKLVRAVIVELALDPPVPEESTN
jgi:precorrin isomerase